MPLAEVKVKDSVYDFVVDLVFPSLLLAVLHDFRCPRASLWRPVSDVVERCSLK